MRWEEKPPTPEPTRHVLHSGHVYLTVRETEGRNEGDPPRRWQHIDISLGRHTDATVAECLENWPKESLRLVREALDAFEEALGEADW